MRLRHMLMAVSIAATGIVVLEGQASAAPTRVGTEAFTLTADINSEGGPVTASGVINATGTDIVVSDTEDTFDFGAQGSITVFHSPLRSRDHFSEKKCSFSFTEKGTYVFGNGTLDWAGYNGSGKYTVKGHAVNACTGPPVGTFTINAKGPINLSTAG
jgi:hypothetical protein